MNPKKELVSVQHAAKSKKSSFKKWRGKKTKPKKSETSQGNCKYPSNSSGSFPNWQLLQEKLKKEKTLQKCGGFIQSAKFESKKSVKKTPLTSNVRKEENGTLTSDRSSKPQSDVWFDDVDPCLIKSSQISSKNGTELKLCKENSFDGLTQYIAIDCEMVGAGFDGNNSILARVSLVNLYGHCVYDKYVKPTEEVTDFRTEVSGIRPENLENAECFKTVQKEVFEIIQKRILVGHAVHHDLKVLYLSQPKHMIRDTSVYFRQFFNNRTPSLKRLSEIYLGIKIQHGEHDSITDAQATMRLYTLFKKKWETSLNRKAKRIRQGKRSCVTAEEKPTIIDKIA